MVVRLEGVELLGFEFGQRFRFFAAGIFRRFEQFSFAGLMGQ